jgi:hypothetical protein
MGAKQVCPGWFILVLGVLFLSAGCEMDDGGDTPNYGQVRLSNESAGLVHLYLGEELGLTVKTGKTGRKRVSEDAQAISVRDEAGNILFSQVAIIPDNTFAEYVVAANGQVYATAGNIKYPDRVGSRDEQIELLNLAAYPVELYANGNLLAYIPAGLNSTIDVPKIMLHVSIRRKGGGVLFEQTLDIPKNAVISYVVQPSGAVIASGEEIDPNDYDDDDYYYDRDGRRRRR